MRCRNIVTPKTPLKQVFDYDRINMLGGVEMKLIHGADNLIQQPFLFASSVR